jgi:hypothetical protein
MAGPNPILRPLVAALALSATFACGGGSCGGCSSNPDYVYPSRQDLDTIPVPDSVKLRMTKDGVQFLEDALPALMAQALADQGGQNGALVIDVPGTTFGFNQDPIEGSVTIADGENGTPNSTATVYTEAFDERMTLGLTDERDGLRITISDLQIGLDVIAAGDVGLVIFGQRLTGIDAACVLGNGNAGPPPHAVRVTVDIDLFPVVDNAHMLDFDVGIRDFSIDDFDVRVHAGTDWQCDDGDLCLPWFLGGQCLDNSRFECEQVLCPALDGLFNVGENLFALLEPALAPVLTNLAEALVNNLAPATPLRSDMQMETGTLVADLASLRRANPLGVHTAVMPGAFSVDCDDRAPGECEDSEHVGMDIALQLGFEAVVESPDEFPNGCVQIGDTLPQFPAPEPFALPATWTDGNGDAQTYAIGMALSEAGLNQLGWALFTSGTLCIDITTAEIGVLTGNSIELNSGMFGLLAGEILAIAGPTAPVMIRLRPTTPPVFDILPGAGPNDDQMKLTLSEFKMEVFVGVDRRFIRAFATLIDMDMTLRLSPEADENGEPIVVIQVSDGPNVGNFQMVYDEPIAGSDLGSTLPALLDVVLGTFLQDALRFDLNLGETLSGALGVPVAAAIAHVETRGDDGSELALYTDLRVGEANPMRASMDPVVAHIDETSLLELKADRWIATGRLAVQLANTEGLEYSTRVDGGPWRVWNEPGNDGVLWVRQPRLMLGGTHRVEMRVRHVGDWRETPQALPPLFVNTDAYAPSLTVLPQPSGWQIAISDLGGTEDVELLVRGEDDDSYRPLASAEIERSDLNPGERLEIVAEDRYGRRSAPVHVDRPRPGVERVLPPHVSSGCNHTGLAGWFLLLPLWALRRRRAA